MAVDLLSGATPAPDVEAPGADDTADDGGGRGRAAALLVASKLGRLAGLLVGVFVLAFVLMEVSPIDPVSAYVGGDSVQVGAEQRDAIAERWGLGDPAPVRFARLAGNILQGDFGTSITFNAPVTQVIAQRFIASFSLLLAAWLLSGVLGFGLGLLAALTRGSKLDRGIRVTAYTLASAPTFWVALLLLTVFSVQLGWTPVSGATPVGIDPATASLGQRLHHLILPAAALSIVGIPAITLHTREQAVEILRSDHATFARAQGETRWGLLRHRILRNAAVPALLLQFASLSELFGGAVLAEQVFGYPGLGQATVRAGIGGDVPLLIGISLFAAVFVFVGNQLGDVAQRLVDPRVPILARTGGEGRARRSRRRPDLAEARQ